MKFDQERQYDLEKFKSWWKHVNAEAYEMEPHLAKVIDDLECWDHEVYAQWIFDYFGRIKKLTDADGNDVSATNVYEIDDRFVQLNSVVTTDTFPSIPDSGHLTLLIPPSIQFDEPVINAHAGRSMIMYYNTKGEACTTHKSEVYVYDELRDVILDLHQDKLLMAMLQGVQIPVQIPQELKEKAKIELEGDDGVFSFDAIKKPA